MSPGITYNVAFETGDLPFSGTDANVFIEIYGENGDTGKIEFNRDDNKSSGRFERGRTDKFAVETADIGKVCVAVNYILQLFHEPALDI